MSMCVCATGCAASPLADPGAFGDSCSCWCHRQQATPDAPPSAEPTVRALSIRQPWASLIVNLGRKDVENRSWRTHQRGELAVHAGSRVDAAAMRQHNLGAVPLGAFLGVVELIEVHHHDDCGGCSPWAEPDRFHWVLREPREFAELIRGNGRLGLFTPPSEVLDAISHDRFAGPRAKEFSR